MRAPVLRTFRGGSHILASIDAPSLEILDLNFENPSSSTPTPHLQDLSNQWYLRHVRLTRSMPDWNDRDTIDPIPSLLQSLPRELLTLEILEGGYEKEINLDSAKWLAIVRFSSLHHNIIDR